MAEYAEPVAEDMAEGEQPLDLDALQRKWSAIVERHERKRGKWIKRADAIVKIYADTDESGMSADRKYSVLWANVQTLGPATYARNPKCVVSRRYSTADQTVRNAVMALERATNLAKDDGNLHAAIMNARQDRFLAGRGTVWHYYEQEDDGQQITAQKVCTDYVAYEDFGHGEGRVWEELDSVWRRAYMDEDELKDRFGSDVMERANVSLDYIEKGEEKDAAQATVYEIWCKSKKMTYWMAKSAKSMLEAGPPPLDLKGFWPCPKPVYATLNNKTLFPTPDYVYYQDQAREITKLTRRIDKLTDSLKLVGFYPKGPSGEGAGEIERALKPGVENVMIPVPSWAAFSEKGGAAALQWLPIDQVIKILQGCVELRKQLIQDIYQITGISDIQRGESNASETLGAQQLKAQYGSNRLRDTKDDFVRFAKEACEIVAEIVAEHFTAETLGKMASLPPYQMQPQQMALPGMDPQQQQPQATQQPMIGPDGQPMQAAWVKLLRNQFARDVLVDVETDSTVQPDENAEKERRIEFATVMGQAMQPLLTINQLDPMVAKAVLPMIGDGITFVARGFRAGRELEERIEQTMTELQQICDMRAQQAMQPQQAQLPPPDPKVEVMAKDVEVKSQLGNRKLDIEAHKAVTDGKAKMIAAAKPHPAPNGSPVQH
jgi:hypothetical protein